MAKSKKPICKSMDNDEIIAAALKALPSVEGECNSNELRADFGDRSVRHRGMGKHEKKLATLLLKTDEGVDEWNPSFCVTSWSSEWFDQQCRSLWFHQIRVASVYHTSGRADRVELNYPVDLKSREAAYKMSAAAAVAEAEAEFGARASGTSVSPWREPTKKGRGHARRYVVGDCLEQSDWAYAEVSECWGAARLTAREIAALPLTPEKRIWALMHLVREHVLLHWRCDQVDTVLLYRYPNFFKRPTEGIEEARNHAYGTSSLGKVRKASRAAERAMNKARSRTAKYAARAAIFHDLGPRGAYKTVLSIANSAMAEKEKGSTETTLGAFARDAELESILRSLVELVENGRMKTEDYSLAGRDEMPRAWDDDWNGFSDAGDDTGFSDPGVWHR